MARQTIISELQQAVDAWRGEFLEGFSLRDAPDFDEFWRRGELALPSGPDDGGFLRAFRNDPAGNKLSTPSGKIEIYSKAIAGFGYDDCPPHPTWLEPAEWDAVRLSLGVAARSVACSPGSIFSVI